MRTALEVEVFGHVSICTRGAFSVDRKVDARALGANRYPLSDVMSSWKPRPEAKDNSLS